jgi:hypothetical protein
MRTRSSKDDDFVTGARSVVKQETEEHLDRTPLEDKYPARTRLR